MFYRVSINMMPPICFLPGYVSPLLPVAHSYVCKLCYEHASHCNLQMGHRDPTDQSVMQITCNILYWDAPSTSQGKPLRLESRFCPLLAITGCTGFPFLGKRNKSSPSRSDHTVPTVIAFHIRKQRDTTQHPISAEDLMLSLKGQLDENIDRCIPLGGCGSYGAPFKLTCTKYGYTVIGKGTTSGLWKEVSREAQVYQILRKAQGSAVPVFLGTIDLAKIYFLRAGQICHMLVMGWGGKCTATMELTQRLRREVHKSNKEIKALGIIHEDLRQDNVLWSEELGRALIIDFHRSTLRCRPAKQRPGAAKRQVEAGDAKRLRAS
jgi:hypothetical protein